MGLRMFVQAISNIDGPDGEIYEIFASATVIAWVVIVQKPNRRWGADPKMFGAQTNNRYSTQVYRIPSLSLRSATCNAR